MTTKISSIHVSHFTRIIQNICRSMKYSRVNCVCAKSPLWCSKNGIWSSGVVLRYTCSAVVDSTCFSAGSVLVQIYSTGFSGHYALYMALYCPWRERPPMAKSVVIITRLVLMHWQYKRTSSLRRTLACTSTKKKVSVLAMFKLWCECDSLWWLPCLKSVTGLPEN